MESAENGAGVSEWKTAFSKQLRTLEAGFTSPLLLLVSEGAGVGFVEALLLWQLSTLAVLAVGFLQVWAGECLPRG
jgi:hypothetical protein